MKVRSRTPVTGRKRARRRPHAWECHDDSVAAKGVEEAGGWPGEGRLAVTRGHAPEFVGLTEGEARRLGEQDGHDVA